MATLREQSSVKTDGPPAENMEFTERARAVFDDYSATMGTAVPNFGHKVSLKDFDGVEWIVETHTDDDQEVYGIMLGKVEDTHSEPDRKAYLSDTPFSSASLGLRLYEPEQILDFVEGKMRELLDPIKAAALRSEDQ